MSKGLTQLFSEDKEINEYLSSLKGQVTTKSPKTSLRKPTFKLDIDVLESQKNTIEENSESVKSPMPLIHNDNTVSCLFLTEKGIFPTNRRRTTWSDTVLFEDDDVIVTATSRPPRNCASGKIENQSTNQNDLDVLYAILAHFSEKKPDEYVKIKFSSIKSLLGWDSYNSGFYYKKIMESIDRIDGLGLRVFDKKLKHSAKINFFENPTPYYEFDGNGFSKVVVLRLNKYIFNQLTKRKLFIPIKKRNQMKSLVGKWLFSYVYSRFLNPYNLTIDEAIKRSGYIGDKKNFVREIKLALKRLNEIGVCNGYVTKGHKQKIVFLKTETIDSK